MIDKKIYFSNYDIFNNLVINKFFSKFIYTKFLIKKKCTRKRKIYYLSLDNFFDNFFFCLRKKYKKLNVNFRLKTGFFFKSDLFIYKHSKLKYYNFQSIKYKSYLKKNIYFCLKYLKNSIFNLGLLFIYKSVRGGFLGFSNKIVGFLTLKYFIFFKKNTLFYKKYLIFAMATCLPFAITNFPVFSLYTSGFKRKFSSLRKKKLARFYFQRFKFFFSSKIIFFKKYLKYFLKSIYSLKLYKSHLIFNILFFKLLFLLKK